MAKQDNTFTWNSISEELKQLIRSRLGGPMTKDLASTKGGTYNLDEAIAFSLFYDAKLMRDDKINLNLVHKLFPEIWARKAIICDRCVACMAKMDKHFADPSYVEKIPAEEFTPPEEVEAPVVEVPESVTMRIEHRLSPEEIASFMSVCRRYGWEVITPSIHLFQNVLIIKLFADHPEVQCVLLGQSLPKTTLIQKLYPPIAL